MRVSVIVQLKSDATMERLRVDVPGILSALQRHSDKSEMIFRSSDGRLFGWFLRTDKPLRVIQSAVTASPHFINGDTILLYEIGDALDGHGFTRQWTWLQHTAK